MKGRVAYPDVISLKLFILGLYQFDLVKVYEQCPAPWRKVRAAGFKRTKLLESTYE